MGDYCEEEGSIRRHYVSSKIQTFQTRRAKVDIVSNLLFGDMLFLDNQLQLATRDEYIYHEMLVHLGMVYVRDPKKVCVLGGADGCAVREVLKWNGVDEIDLYDYDAELVEKFRGELSSWNSDSLNNRKVRVFTEDIRDLIRSDEKKSYDCIFMDLTDPSSWGTGQDNLWSSTLSLMKQWLAPHGVIVMNAGGILPWDSSSIEYGLHRITEEFSGSDRRLHVFKTFVPSFAGEWCFFVIRPADGERVEMIDTLQGRFRFFSDHVLLRTALWTKDFSAVIPRNSAKLKTYLPLLHGRENE